MTRIETLLHRCGTYLETSRAFAGTNQDIINAIAAKGIAAVIRPYSGSARLAHPQGCEAQPNDPDFTEIAFTWEGWEILISEWDDMHASKDGVRVDCPPI